MAAELLQNFKGVGLLAVYSKNLSKGEVGVDFELEDGSRLRGFLSYWKHHRLSQLRLGMCLSVTVNEGQIVLDDEIGSVGPCSISCSEIRDLKPLRPVMERYVF